LRPLDNIIVLDLTRLLPGAWTTQILSDFGADVIKVEELPLGEPGRRLPPASAGESDLFRLTNKGKKSIAINLKDERGKNAFFRLVDGSDVVIESFRPGVAERLGISYKELRLRNPRLIYAAITGYGQTGPNALLPGHDINYVSMAGLLDLMRMADGRPLIPPIQIADLVGGSLQAVIGILLALLCRSVTGLGQMVDIGMAEGILPLLAVPLIMQRAREQERFGAGLLTGSFACYNVYQARDGIWISVGALEAKFWLALCEALQLEDFIPDQFAPAPRQAEIIRRFSQSFRERDASDWFTLLKQACVTPFAPASREEPGIVPRLSMTPGQRGGNPPAVGKDSNEILIFAGFTSKEIEELERSKVVMVNRDLA
jgi:crotonobetainyl-CoA:carnitine CoA-transferase CaiB-like acyl-CoA transferase